MRKLTTAVVLAALVAGVVVSYAWAKPKSALGAVLGVWAKRDAKVIAIRRNADAVLTIVTFDGEKLAAFEKAPKKDRVERVPLLEYDIEKLKTIGADAGWAHKQVMEYRPLLGKPPVIKAIKLVEAPDGSLLWNVYVYTQTNIFRGAWVVDAKTWEVQKSRVTENDITDPDDEQWTGDVIEKEEPEEGGEDEGEDQAE